MKTLFLAREGRDSHLAEIAALARERRIPLEYRDRRAMDELAAGGLHQGVVGFCSDYGYADGDALISETVRSGGILLLLDGLSDPGNFGAIIRTAHCFGVRGIVIPRDRSVRVTPTVMKASSGALLQVPVASVVNLARTLDEMKKAGFWIYGTDAKDGKDPRSFDFRGPIGIVFGSEGKGVRPLVRKKCDAFLAVPMSRPFDSLNVSVAAGIVLHEIFRKRAESQADVQGTG
jgi:23S rRNA (guanosine2251-2'-O)-methyltransferase